MTMLDAALNEIEVTILELLEERGPGKTICPSEAARRIASLTGHPDRWRAWLNRTRATAMLMAKRGAVIMLQHGQPVDPDIIRGAIRLRLP